MKKIILRSSVVVVSGVILLLWLQNILARDEKIDPASIAQTPTRQVTVQDVLAADIPSPIVETVSFPNFPYSQAFPGSDIGPEQITKIDHFSEAPMLKNLDSMSPQLRKHYPDSLEPVAERLPENPLVVMGCDGIGQYGGVMHRCTRETGRIAQMMMPESFTRFDPSGRLVPALAWKWEVEPGNRVFTFYLRKGHKWSDGKPFTTEDILWVCNTLIGSSYWSSLPNWMQSTDGRAQLYTTCITDWPLFIEHLSDQGTNEDGSPKIGKLVADIAGDEINKLLTQLKSDIEDTKVRRELMDLLNQCFRNEKFYNPATFASADITSEKKALEAIGASKLTRQQVERLILLNERQELCVVGAEDVTQLTESAMSKLGLLMFRALLTDCVDKARVIRVKIEAVADETGDTSHIVRFTFPRPNSIFLEKTATFMFYRGIFVLSKHYTAPLHPDGSDIVNVIDILDWDAFGEKLAAALQASENDPMTQLVNAMPADFRQSLQSNPVSSTSEKAYKQQVIDAVNAALASRDYFEQKLWENINYDGEYDDLLGAGFIELRRNRTGLNRCRQLMVRADLLRRLREDGRQSLSDKEIYTLNEMMFRAALDGRQYMDSPIVAYNREDALNKQAQNHPRRFGNWVALMRGLNDYDEQHNSHYPTLRAWRHVTKKADKVALHIRNPYYYRVDPAGNQLPYIDAIETTYENEESIRLLKMSSGNIDFQVTSLGFENFTYLKQREKAGGYSIGMWAADDCGGVFFYPAQAHKEARYRQLQDDSRFRHALSLALDRRQIVDVCFQGLGEPAQYAIPKGSPYYSEYHANMSLEYDPEKANKLLDEMGLTKRNSAGFRIFPDGSGPIVMNLDISDDRALKVALIACEQWRKIGLNVQAKMRSQTVINRMLDIGIQDMGVAWGGANYYGPLLAGGFAPTHPAECAQWGPWTKYIRQGGRAGWPAPQRLREVDALWENVLSAATDEEKYENWQILARRTADDLPRIGVYAPPGRLVYKGRRIRNVPELALAGWIAHSPGNCCPEAFWLDGDE